MKIKRAFYTPFQQNIEVENYETVTCNLCGNPDFTVIGNEMQFEIRSCTNCGLVYVSPQPSEEEMPKFYEGMYAEGTDKEAETRSFGLWEPHLRSLLEKRAPEASFILDVGCGFGKLLKSLETSGAQLTGIELSNTAVEYVRSHVKDATIHQGGIFDIDLPEESQDVIYLVAVLEHLRDPAMALKRIVSWLKPGGFLVVQVPYVAPFIRAKRWIPFIPVSFEAPRHLFDFSPQILRRYLNESGIEKLETEIARPYGGSSALYQYLIWAVKLPGFILYWLTGRNYIYPFSCAIVCHGIKKL